MSLVPGGDRGGVRMTTDIEVIIERDFMRAVQVQHDTHRRRWVLAILAHRIVGRYTQGLTQEFADRLGVSVDAVELWARAWAMYKQIRFRINSEAAHLYAGELTITHLGTMDKLAAKHALPPQACDHHLLNIVSRKIAGDRYSVATLAQDVEADRPGQKPVDWHYHWNRLKKPLEIMASFDGELDPDIKRWVLAGLALLGDYDVV